MLLVLAAGLVALWKNYLEDRLLPRRWGEVEAGVLYRSGQLHPALVERTLREHHIQVVVDLTDDQPAAPEDRAEAQAAEDLGIERHIYPLSGDGTGDYHRYVEALTTISEAVSGHRPALVHCAAGSQRTGGAVALYRLLVQHVPAREVLAEMERYGWDPEKDRVLLEYLDQHMARIAQALEQRGVIDRLPDPLPRLEDAAGGG